MAGIDYYYKESELDIFGNLCPTCGAKLWNIFKCECGKVFCRECRSDLVEIDHELDCVEVKCDCGNVQLFIDI